MDEGTRACWRHLDEARLSALGHALGSVSPRGALLLLVGPMGAGKTTFTRALARGLGLHRPDRVRSPTFNLAQRHEGPIPLLHVDVFRLAGFDAEAPAAAFEALALQDLLDASMATESAEDTRGSVCVIEWADLLFPPAVRQPEAPHLWIELSAPDEEHRDLQVDARGVEGVALLAAWQAACP